MFGMFLNNLKKMCFLHQLKCQKWNPRFLGSVYSAHFRTSCVTFTHCAFPLLKRPLVTGHPPRSKENAITLGWAPLSVMVLAFKYKFSHSRTEITCNSLLGQSPGVAIIPLGSAHSCCFNVSFSPPFLF